jgi:hypothetical protein
MVLDFKIDPKEVNKGILQHPVVILRRRACGPIPKEKEIVTKEYAKFFFFHFFSTST